MWYLYITCWFVFVKDRKLRSYIFMISQVANLEPKVVASVEKLFVRVILIVRNLEILSKEIGFEEKATMTPPCLF